MFVRERGGDPGALHSGDVAPFDRRGGDGGSGVAGTDDAVGIAALHEIDRDADGGIFFLTHRLHRGIVHRHDLGGVHDLDLGMRVGESVELTFHGRFVADKKELLEVAIIGFESLDRARHDSLGSLVASHHIQCDSHELS